MLSSHPERKMSWQNYDSSKWLGFEMSSCHLLLECNVNAKHEYLINVFGERFFYDGAMYSWQICIDLCCKHSKTVKSSRSLKKIP